MREVCAYLEHSRLDPSTGCFHLDRAMAAATHLAQVTNGHRRDTLVRSHARANAAARSLARLAQASTLGTNTVIPRIYQPTDTNIPDDHILGFLDSGSEDNEAIRTVLLLLDAARAGRQRHAWGGDPSPAVYAPLEGDETWAPWSPRAFTAIAEQAQLQLDALIDDAHTAQPPQR